MTYLIAQIQAGGMYGGTEIKIKKGTFKMEQIDIALASFNEEVGANSTYDDIGKGDELFDIFNDGGPLDSMFEPAWRGVDGFVAIMDRVDEGETVFIGAEEYLTVIAQDDNGDVKRSQVLTELRSEWTKYDEKEDKDDLDGWD